VLRLPLCKAPSVKGIQNGFLLRRSQMFCATCLSMILGNKYDGIEIDDIDCGGTVTIGPGNIIAENMDEGIEIGCVDGSLSIIDNIIGAWDFAPLLETAGDPGLVGGNCDDGIFIHSTGPSSSVLIRDNHIHENGWCGSCDGIEMDWVDGTVEILDNVIGAWTHWVYDNQTVVGSQDFMGNWCDGIDIDDVDGTVLIDGNHIANNEDTGIEIDDIESDREHDPCLDSCVHLYGSVTISNNYAGGWLDEEEEYVDSDNQDEGIRIGSDSDVDPGCTLDIGPNNIIEDNGHTGIYVCDISSRAEATIHDNYIAENGTGLWGIYMDNCDGVIIDHNTIHDHADMGGTGIYLWSSKCNSIINNTITENCCGIELTSGSFGNGIVGNWIEDNLCHGICCWDGHQDIFRNHIEGNIGSVTDCDNCGGCGIVVGERAEGVMIYYNEFVDNTDLDTGSYGLFVYREPGPPGRDSRVIDARWNWWNDASGPYHGGTNPLGLGDAVSSFVDYSEWATEEFGYSIDASMPWDTEGPDIISATSAPHMVSLYSALEDMRDSTWTADSPFSTGPSEANYCVITTDVDPSAPPRGVRSVEIDMRAFVEQLMGGTSLEAMDDVSWWFIDMLEDEGNLTLCDGCRDLCCDCSIWTAEGTLPFSVSKLLGWLGDDLFFSMVRPGEYMVPVIVTDWAGNTSSTDIEAAVVDEALALGRGWNLRSTPINLAYNSWADIAGLGDGLDYMACYRWNADTNQWEQLTDAGLLDKYGANIGDAIVRPLDGLAIKCENPDALGLVYDREGQPGLPSLPVYDGWNLVGLAVSPPQDPWMPVSEALISVEEVLADGVRGYIIAASPRQYVETEVEYRCAPCCHGKGMGIDYDWYFGQNSWQFLRHGLEPEGEIPNMTVGGAYWVFMERDDILAGFSSTPHLSTVLEQGEDIPCIPRWEGSTMIWYHDWLTAMRCPCWEHQVPDGWQGLQFVEIEYKGEFTLEQAFAFYEAQMPLTCGWQFGYKVVFDYKGDHREGKIAFWKEAEFGGIPYYTDIAHLTFNTYEDGPDRIELIYLPVDIPTLPGTNLVEVNSFPWIYFDMPMELYYQGAGSIEDAVEYYAEAMAKLGWTLECTEEVWEDCGFFCSELVGYNLCFDTASLSGWSDYLNCEIEITNGDAADILQIDIDRGTGDCECPML